LRKFVIAACIAALSLATAVTVHAAVVKQTLDGGLTPSKSGTAKKPKAAKLDLHLFATTDDGSNPPASKRVQVRLPRGLAFNGSKLAQCTLAAIQDSSKDPDTVCKKGSKIGGGSAKAKLGSSDINLTVRVYNGPKGKSVLLRLDTAPGANPAVHTGFEAKLKKLSGGPYGFLLDVTIPKSLYNPLQGVFTPLTDFKTTVKSVQRIKGKQVSVVTTTSCPKSKKWQFKADWEYADSTARDTASDVQKCS
jgi:hypothetical protein